MIRKLLLAAIVLMGAEWSATQARADYTVRVWYSSGIVVTYSWSDATRMWSVIEVGSY